MLDRNYNVLKRIYVHHPLLFRWQDIKVLHFVGNKPWATITNPDPRYQDLERKWFAFLRPEEVLEVAREQVSDTSKETRFEDIISRTARNGIAWRKLRKFRRDPIQFFRDARVVRRLSKPN